MAFPVQEAQAVADPEVMGLPAAGRPGRRGGLAALVRPDQQRAGDDLLPVRPGKLQAVERPGDPAQRDGRLAPDGLDPGRDLGHPHGPGPTSTSRSKPRLPGRPIEDDLPPPDYAAKTGEGLNREGPWS